MRTARGAYMFLKFLTSTENIVQWAEAFGTVPIYKEARESAEFQQFAETNIAVKALTEEADDIGMLAQRPRRSGHAHGDRQDGPERCPQCQRRRHRLCGL